MRPAAPLLCALCAALSASPAFAEDAPPFLGGGAVYASDREVCTAPDWDDGSGLRLTSAGVYGYEFGCTFVDFRAVRLNDGDDIPDEYIALASCGDDSGISRPDMILLMPFGEGSLTVTSQNDYTMADSLRQDGLSDPSSLVQREFMRCGE